MSADQRKRPGSALGDYLRLKSLFSATDVEHAARFLSLEHTEDIEPVTGVGDVRAGPDISGGNSGGIDPAPGDPFNQAVYPKQIPPIRFTRHLERLPEKPQQEYQRREPAAVTREKTEEFQKKTIDPVLLQSWQALWPFLKRHLSEPEQNRKIDISRVVCDVSANRPLTKIPFKTVQQWPQSIVVIVDLSRHLRPVFDDFFEIVRKLQQWFPKRINCFCTEDAERPGFVDMDTKLVHDTLPDISVHSAVLVLSDLGQLHQRPWSMCNWQQWGQQLNTKRIKPLVLLTACPSDWKPDVTRFFDCACFDYGCQLEIQASRIGHVNSAGKGMDRLLQVLSPLARITPAMLRQARISHPDALSVSDEIRFWSKLEFGSRLHFRHWLDRDQQQNAIDELGRDRTLSRLSEKIMLQFEHSIPQRLQIQQKQQFRPIKELALNEQQHTYLEHLAESKDNLDSLDRRFLDNWMAFLDDRKGDSSLIEAIQPLFSQYYDALSDPERKSMDAPVSHVTPLQDLRVLECNTGLEVRTVQSNVRAIGEWPIISIDNTSRALITGHEMKDISRRSVKRTMREAEILELSNKLNRVRISTDLYRDTLEVLTCPDWASGIGRDRYGLFSEVDVAGVEFIMRWIPAGGFLMGSPKSEAERYDAEGPQHRVEFRQGYWLAETACTQALWEAVMSDNPSRFGGNPENPVESVSWELAQEFIARLNSEGGEPGYRLPSEAEWEYACRAGTETAFWFGDKLSADDANYDGNHPYADGEKGEYRKTTVGVKQFKRNPWGLYQMHGNVWEWCEDAWHDNYQGAPSDGSAWSSGGDTERAVCRGGSWIADGRFLRSAYRNGVAIVYVYGSRGFRLARGPVSSGPARADAQ